jgi:DNA-binding response OmpR family regulator
MARILVIDDESNIRMMLRLALAYAGHTVETAADGYEGLERFGPDGSGWDLVLLDQRMPGMEGLEALREMRRRDPDARVVMITAFGTVDLAIEAMAAGATDFLRKPFTVETLRAAVAAALEDVPRIAGATDFLRKPFTVETLRAAVNAALEDVPRLAASGKAVGERSPIPYAFDQTTVNGFRLHSAPGVATGPDGAVGDVFTVRTAAGDEQKVSVTLPPYVVELVKAHADRDEMPGGPRFWQALCGEALANYLWQHADLPEGNTLLVDDLTSGLRHWIDAVLSAEGEERAAAGAGAG